jgi:thioredoxin 2
MNENARLIVCPHCARVNRVPMERAARGAKCGHCHQPLFTGEPIAATAANFLTHIGRNNIPVAVDFWAEWCGPCHMLAPVFARMAAELEPEFRFLKVDTEAEPQLAARFNIRSIPMVMLFRNGRIVAQQAGAMAAGALRDWLRQNAGTAPTR